MVGNTYTKGRKNPKEEMLKRFCFKPGNQFAKGVKQSEEQRRKRSEDQKAYWANWRLKKTESGRITQWATIFEQLDHGATLDGYGGLFTNANPTRPA